MKKIAKLLTILMSAAIACTFWGCENPAASNDNNGGDSNGKVQKQIAVLSDLETPLTIDAIEDTEIVFNNPWTTFKYKLNDGSFKTVNAVPVYDGQETPKSAKINIKVGDKIALYADGSENTSGTFFNIDFSKDCYVYGNVMSLLDSQNFKDATSISDEYAFMGLFLGNGRLKNHAEKKILLPATMLSTKCYGYMFYQCSALTVAPELPAATLTESCYEGMFSNCTSLNYIKCLAKDITAEYCTSGWVQGVAATGKFVKENGVNWNTDNDGIPSNWTVETLKPEYDIICSDSNIELSKTSAMEGETITISVNNALKDIINTIYVKKNNNSEEILLSGNDTTKTFIMPAEAVTVSASYNILLSSVLQNGSLKITKDNKEVTSAFPGETIIVTATPADDYELKNFSLIYIGDGMGPLPFTQNGNSCTFTMPNGTVLPAALFEKMKIGLKDRPTEAGDIVFNDGTALPASEYNSRELTDREKKNAIAVVAYVYMVNGKPDVCITVGLKQEYKPLCSNTAIGLTTPEAFSTYKNGKDYKDSGEVRDIICNGDLNNLISDYNETNYPAFYWAQHYPGFNNLGEITNDWLIPTLSELLDIYEGKEVVIAAIEKIGDKYAEPLIKPGNTCYFTVSQFANNNNSAWVMDLTNKDNKGGYIKDGYSSILVIRYFQCHD